jgi:hypothetical protein
MAIQEEGGLSIRFRRSFLAIKHHGACRPHRAQSLVALHS